MPFLVDFTLLRDTPRGAFRLYVNCARREATLNGPRLVSTVKFADVDAPDKAARWLENNAQRIAATLFAA